MPLMAAPPANTCCFHMVGLFTYAVGHHLAVLNLIYIWPCVVVHYLEVSAATFRAFLVCHFIGF